MKTVVMLAAALFCAAASTRAWAEISFTSCGGTVPAHQTGVLQNDVVCQYRCASDPSIVCDGDSSDACSTYCQADRFLLERGARLKLNGHHVRFAYQASAVGCQDPHPGGYCAIIGPGVVEGGKGTGVWARGMDMVLVNVSITFTDAAVYVDQHLFARQLTIAADRENGIYAAKGVDIGDSSIDGESGVSSGADLKIRNSQLGPHGGAAAKGALLGRHLAVQAGAPIVGKSVDLKRVNIVPDPFGDRLSLVSSESSLHLRRSHVQMIESAFPPDLARSTCSKSSRLGSDVSWGVCADD